MGYSQSGAISGLLAEKSNAENLLRDHSTILLRAAKSVDEGVIGVETLERWHRLKVHGMHLMRYLGKRKMELPRNRIVYRDKVEDYISIVDKQSASRRMS